MVKMEPVNVGDIVSRAQNTLRKVYEERSIEFEITLTSNSIIIGDSDLLE